MNVNISATILLEMEVATYTLISRGSHLETNMIKRATTLQRRRITYD